MAVRQVDPRDQEWEIAEPRFRVHLQAEDGSTSEFEFAGEGLADVLAWISSRTRRERYTLYAAVTVDERPGLIVLGDGWSGEP